MKSSFNVLLHWHYRRAALTYIPSDSLGALC